MTKQHVFSFLFYLSTSLSFLLGTAHFYRAGLYPFAFLCIICIFLLFQKMAYLKNILSIALMLLGIRYFLVTIDFIQLRQALAEPWLRLFAILGTVSFFIFLNAFYVYKQKNRYTKNVEFSTLSTITFLVIFSLLLCLHFNMPYLHLTNRFFYGFGMVQAFIIALWGAFVVVKLSDKSIAEKWRVRIWRIFSLIFFAQFFLALLGYSIFLMGNTFHFPIPAMIVAGPLYRESGFFMPILFLVSFLLVGSAWCSHLCYFGVWDTVPKKSLGHKHRHKKLDLNNNLSSSVKNIAEHMSDSMLQNKREQTEKILTKVPAKITVENTGDIKNNSDNKKGILENSQATIQNLTLPQQEKVMTPIMEKIFRALPYTIFILMLCIVFACKNYEVPIHLTFSLILLVGLLFFPFHFFISRKYLISSYCLYVCPLGVLMRFFNKISYKKFSWHLSFTDTCTKCGKCARFCRYKAITKESIKTQSISEACTLCRHCMHVCRKNGLELSYCGFKGKHSNTLNTIFTTLITILHSLFLAVAMV